MTRELDLDDIQGNVIRAYGKFGYPKARYFFIGLTNAWVGREFVRRVQDKVTTARRWPKNSAGEREGPPITMNIGFTFMGLYMMELPTRTLQGMPDDFIDGMRKRAFILGDQPLSDVTRVEQPVLPTDPVPDWMKNWDPIWQDNRRAPGLPGDVHIWVSMNAKVIPGTETPVPGSDGETDILEERTQWLRDTCREVCEAYARHHTGKKGTDDSSQSRGWIGIIAKNGKDGDQEYQEASAVFDDIYDDKGNKLRLPTPYEHFGLSDGIGDPVFEGQFDEAETRAKVKGRGKWMDPDKGWEPLATGEFLLGHPDESQELPPAARPPEFSHNGTFMAYRKLHENVTSWNDYFKAEAKTYAKMTGLTEEQADVTLRSKAVGRWPDGVPLQRAGTHKEWEKVRAEHGLKYANEEKKDLATYLRRLAYLRSEHASDFKYAHDMQGYDCPNSSHLRRVNTRDYLDPINDMHPELNKDKNVNKNANTSLNKRRRIMRRGLPYGPSTLSEGKDEGEQGVAMMIICANLFRQFEFVQQQWIQYGLDFNSGNNTCPLVGDHSKHTRFTVPADPAKDGVPYVCEGLKNFVEPRGGEYFFIPSMTALSMIADGVVDPT
ncbi:MAG: peroxidase [Pseudomonadota bacterium]